LKVLVTGGCGFIGSHIVDMLIEHDYEVVVIDNLSTSSKKSLHRDATLHEVDITNIEDLEKIFEKEKPAFVIHQAAQVSVSASMHDPIQDARQNVLGSLNVLQCCVNHHVKKIIYASSCAVYGETDDLSIIESSPIQPLSFYGLSKYTPESYMELYSRQYGLPYTILRYANVYGPRQSVKGEGGVVAVFIQKMLNNDIPVIFGDGDQTRDFVYVKDVARANLLALEKGINGVLNIGTNTKTSINQLVHTLSLFLPLKGDPIYQPERPGDIRFSRLDASKANQILHWEPLFDLPKGLFQTIDYYCNQKNN
jgi:UDP-glucose 4-epimerase